MATYVNDLRLKEIATGDEAGTWGTSTNTNLELIGEAFSFGTEAITTNADTHTTTIADGSTDPGRSMYLKYTGTLDSACTITIGPNTVSKMWFIENATSGSQNIIISQGSGANITIPAGDVKVIYSDGAGSGAAVVDAFASLNVVDLKVQDDLTVTDDMTVGGTLGVTGVLTATSLDISGDIDVDGTTNLDVVDIDGAVDMATTLAVAGNVDFNGDLDVDGTTNLDVVDIDGAVDMASTLAVAGVLTGASLDISGDIDVDGTTNLDVVDIDGAVDFASTTAHAGNATFADNAKAIFGADNDLQIYHDGSNSYIKENGTGALNILGQGQINLKNSTGDETLAQFLANSRVDLYYDNAIKFTTTSTGVDVTGIITTDGLTTSADINFGDNDKAVFGAGSDLQIYHDASHSYIVDAGTGNMYLSTNGNGIVMQASLSETMFAALPNGAVTLYYDNAAKLATTSTGIDVTGTATMDGLTVDGDITVSDATPSLTLSDTGGTNQKFVVSHNGATSYLTFRNGTNYGAVQFLADNGTATVTRQSISSGGDISFYDDTGTSQALFWDASAESLGIGTTSPAYKLSLADTTQAGTTVQLFRTGSAAGSMFINGGLAFGADGGNGDTQRMVISSSTGNVGIGTTSPTRKLSISGTGSEYINIVGGTTSGVGLLLGDSNAEINAAIICDNSTDALSFRTGGNNTRMTVDGSGNVGIGTSSPSTTLHVTSAAGSNKSAIITRTSGAEAVNLSEMQDYNALQILNKASGSYLNFAGNASASQIQAQSNGSTAEDIALNPYGGNVGIGTSSPYKSLTVGDSDASAWITSGGANTHLTLSSNGSSGAVIFRTGGTNGDPSATTERMRIDSSGMLLVGKTSSGTGYNGMQVHTNDFMSYTNGSTDTGDRCLILNRQQCTGAGDMVNFRTQNSNKGTISYNGSAMNYGGTSDYRLKENLKPIENGLDRLNQLNPVSFDWKETGIKSEGFIAHEVQEIFTDAVSGEKDGEHMQQLDYGRITPLLVKAIQEQQTIIDDLKTRIEALEG